MLFSFCSKKLRFYSFPFQKTSFFGISKAFFWNGTKRKKNSEKITNSLKFFNWLVEISGLEPLTSALQGQRSTN